MAIFPIMPQPSPRRARLAFTWRIGAGSFGGTTLTEAIAAHQGERVPDAVVDRDDPCWFFFSGTTGRSKAAVLTHGQMGFVITNHLADLVGLDGS